MFLNSSLLCLHSSVDLDTVIAYNGISFSSLDMRGEGERGEEERDEDREERRRGRRGRRGERERMTGCRTYIDLLLLATFNSAGLGADEFNVTSCTVYADCDFTSATIDSSVVYGPQIRCDNLYSNSKNCHENIIYVLIHLAGSSFEHDSMYFFYSAEIINGRVKADYMYLSSNTSVVFIEYDHLQSLFPLLLLTFL